MKKTKYVVMRLHTQVKVALPIEGSVSVKLKGCAGYMPIFNTLKQAEKYAGKIYQILPITITK